LFRGEGSIAERLLEEKKNWESVVLVSKERNLLSGKGWSVGSGLLQGQRSENESNQLNLGVAN
jgi:hypothetical protein